MKKILSTFLLGATLFMAGCEKEKVFFEEELNGAKTGAGFGLPNQEPLSFTVDASLASLTTALNVFIANNGSGTVSLAVDAGLVDAYNEANGSDFAVMPDGTYNIPTSISISGGSGSADATFDIQTLLSSGISFAIGVKISSVSGGTDYVLPGNSEKIIIVQVKNAYDGVYILTGRTAHPTNSVLTGPIGPKTVELATNDANSVLWDSDASGNHPWANGSGSTLPDGYEPLYIIDPVTNAVTVVNDAVGMSNIPGADNYYDPATKTIYASYKYTSTGGDRQFYDILTYDHAR